MHGAPWKWIPWCAGTQAGIPARASKQNNGFLNVVSRLSTTAWACGLRFLSPKIGISADAAFIRILLKMANQYREKAPWDIILHRPTGAGALQQRRQQHL